MRKRWQRAGRKIRVEHGFDEEIEGFPAELRQVFTNVIKNAVEATDEGGSIRVFSVSTQDAGRNGVLVHVTDNGVGIPEQMKSRLFSPFATTEQASGSGLGLWVSRSILEKYDGTIRVSSPDSGYSGTTVSIFCPLQQHLGQALTTLPQPLMVMAIKKCRRRHTLSVIVG